MSFFQSRFSFKDVSEADIQKKISNLNSKKAGIFGKIPTEVLKESSEICNIVLKNKWNYEILGTHYFSDSLCEYFLKLVDATPVYERYKKKDATLLEKIRPLSVLPIVSKIFEKIAQK